MNGNGDLGGAFGYDGAMDGSLDGASPNGVSPNGYSPNGYSPNGYVDMSDLGHDMGTEPSLAVFGVEEGLAELPSIPDLGEAFDIEMQSYTPPPSLPEVSPEVSPTVIGTTAYATRTFQGSFVFGLAVPVANFIGRAIDVGLAMVFSLVPGLAPYGVAFKGAEALVGTRTGTVIAKGLTGISVPGVSAQHPGLGISVPAMKGGTPITELSYAGMKTEGWGSGIGSIPVIQKETSYLSSYYSKAYPSAFSKKEGGMIVFGTSAKTEKEGESLLKKQETLDLKPFLFVGALAIGAMALKGKR